MWFGGGGYGLGQNIKLTNPNDTSYQRASVENAVSSAASCRHCQNKIAQNSLRVRYGSSRFVHLRCWKGPDRIKVKDDYFYSHLPLDDSDTAKLASWIKKHNEKVAKKTIVAPKLTEKAVSTGSVAPAPSAAIEGEESAFGRITTDTFTYVMSFLSIPELARIERVCKSFLRAAKKSWENRYLDLGVGKYDATKFSSAKLALLFGTCHGCHKFITSENSTFVKSLKRSVCQTCSAEKEDYRMVAKKYLSGHGLTPGDITKFKIPFEKRPNPYGRNLAAMTVFLVWDLKRARERKESAAASPSAKKKSKK